MRNRFAVPVLVAVAVLVGVPGLNVASAGKLDVRSRSSVLKGYNKLLRASDVPANWKGDVAKGDAGKVSKPFLNATLAAVNFYRAMAGVDSAKLRSEFTAKARLAALMMAVNGRLDHEPPRSWKFWSDDGFEAAGESNLGLGYTGARAVGAYIEDEGRGSINADVGHRRWIIDPDAVEIGSGDVFTTDEYGANALWVVPIIEFDLITGIRLTPLRPARDGFVSWPPPGFVPHTLVHRRWSFSMKDADFSGARVVVRDGKKRVRAKIVSSTALFGGPGIVFEPKVKLRRQTSLSYNIEESTHIVAPERLRTFTVTVSDVLDPATGELKSFTYRVRVFPVAVRGS